MQPAATASDAVATIETSGLIEPLPRGVEETDPPPLVELVVACSAVDPLPIVTGVYVTPFRLAAYSAACQLWNGQVEG